MSTDTQYGPKTTAVLASIERTRKSLSEAALDDTKDYETLGRIVNDLARAYGALAVAHLEDATENVYGDTDIGRENLRAAVLSLVLQPVDDTWSGRGNDLKRSRHDGIQSAASKVLRGF